MSSASTNARSRAIRVDLLEGEDAFLLLADLPGVEEPDIHVELEGQRLQLSATRSNDDVPIHYARRVRVPAGVDAEKVSARYAEGVLEVRLEKQAALKPRRITVGA